MPEVGEIEAVISGRVTGVLFRDFVRRQALALGLVGTVENLPNQTVRVVAQGEAQSLRQLVGYLNQGSWFSRVEAVAVIWRQPGAAFNNFRIIGNKL